MSAVLFTLVSAKGSPGVTTATLALGAEWPRTAVVIDADAAGGDVAAGLGRGSWPPNATLVGLALEARRTSVEAALRRLVVQPATHAPLTLAGVTRLGQLNALPWLELVVGFRAIADADLLCDGGRYSATDGPHELLQASDHVVLVTRSSLRAVRAAVRMVPLLYEALSASSVLSLLVVESGRPYAAADIAANCGLELLGELPLDPRAARVWSDGFAPARGWRRSRLHREARRVAERLSEAEDGR